VGPGRTVPSLDLVVAGLADRINNTLAIVLLNVEYLDDLIDELAEAAARPRTQIDGVIGDVMSAVERIREIVRDVEHLSGDGHGDAAETFAAVLRLARPALAQTELVEDVRGPAPTSVPRGRLATISAIAIGEARRALDGCRGTLTASIDRGDHEIAIAVRAAVADGAHRLDGEHASWEHVRALLADHQGRLAVERSDASFAIEIRLPAAQG